MQEVLFSIAQDRSWQLLIVALCLLMMASFIKITGFRRFLFVLSIIINGFAFTSVALRPYTLYSLAILITVLFCVLLGLIGRSERYQTAKAQRKVRANTIYLGGMIQILFIFEVASTLNRYVNSVLADALLIVISVAACTLLLTTIVRARRSIKPGTMSSDSPAVTLAIPARNETHALTASLDVAIDTDYKKLEILVLDDCSSDRTPEIIKSFARGGVRFIGGEVLPEQWLGKTFAYSQLLKHASGEYVIFSGVDVYTKRESIGVAIGHMQQNALEMMSVAPQRNSGDFLSNLLQSVRYFWQLALPRPRSALSSVWIVRRDSLRTLAGFTTVKNSIQPERELALRIPAQRYQFVASTNNLFTTRKRLSSQYETLIRNSYPNAGSSVTVVALSLISTLFISSFMVAAASSQQILWLLPIVVTVTAFGVANARLLRPLHAAATTLLMPIALVVQLAGLIISMLRYELGSIGWKDRNVCIPVLSQKPRLDR